MRKTILLALFCAIHSIGLFATTPTNLQMVNPGLPSGTFWANMNVGATNSYEYGNYYSWAGTTPNQYFDWDTYFDTNDGVHFALYHNNGGWTVIVIGRLLFLQLTTPWPI